MKLSFVAIALALFLTGIPCTMHAQEETPEQKAKRMEWFEDAKLGIFIHWGIYAVNGISESWSFHNGYITHENYMHQLDGFTAENYNPKEWAKLIKKSGAQYAVLTAKHHDGVALWDTELYGLNVVDSTPAGRDLVGPFCKALRKQDIKVGLYYSLIDWSHPNYPNFLRNQKRYENDSVKWAAFTKFNHGQINELTSLYKPDLYWFDGDWEFKADMWKADTIRYNILSANPRAIINSRLQGYGDYATPEQGVPLQKPEKPYWELCMTINDSWGYQQNDLNHKSPYQVIRIFAECIGMGGNLLLDIAPKADGTIPEEQVEVLEELGRWTNKHKEAIYGSKAGLPTGLFDGPSTLSSDSTILYLFLPYKPNGPIMLKGVKNKINRITVVGNGTRLNHQVYMKPYWSSYPGLVFIDVPEEYLDPQITVIALMLDGKLEVETKH